LARRSSRRRGPRWIASFLPLADNRVVALLLASGETVWERTFSAPVTALLALEDQLVFGTTAKEVMSIDVARGPRSMDVDNRRRHGG
jgi:hypothetical protein